MADFVRQSTESGGSATVHGSFMYIVSGGVNVRRSTDGISWTDLGESTKKDIITFDGFVYITGSGGGGGGVQRTSSTTFSSKNFGAGLFRYETLEIFDGFLYVGGTNRSNATQRDNIGRTSDGVTWTPVTGNVGLDNFFDTVRDLQVFDGKIYAVLVDGGGVNTKVFRSSNGTSWTEVLSVSGANFAMGVLGNTLYLFSSTGVSRLHTTTTGNLGEWTDTGLEIGTSFHAAETIDNRLWCGGGAVTEPGFIGNGTTFEEVTFDIDIPPGTIGDWVDFLGFVWAVSGSGIYKGPASSGYVFTPAPEEFRLPVLQDFDWQPPVTAIQDTPPA